MNETAFLSLLKSDFPHQLTQGQDQALQLLARFVLDKSPDRIFMLKGYAGTGKTTLVGTLVKNLWKAQMSSVLLAPPGRAAKVISNYSGRQAFTIHKKKSNTGTAQYF